MTNPSPSPHPSSFRPFWQLSRRDQVAVVWTVFRLQARLIFSHRFVWFAGALVISLSVMYTINFYLPVYDRMDREVIYIVIMSIPMSVLALYLNMQVIVSEKDQRTLEVMFTTAGSRYKVWLIRVGSLNVILLTITLLISILAFFTFADIPVIGMACNAFATIFFIGNLTLYFAVRLRSGLAAGMVTGLIIILHLMFSDFYNETRYFLFFNPYEIPRELDPLTWELWGWQNRIGVFLLGLLLFFFALRGMEKRDRLLR